MSRRCSISGKGVQTGHRVSHANNKTKRRFMPNLQSTRLMSDALGKPVRLRLTPHAIRTIEHNGGLDAYLLTVSDTRLSDEARRLKHRIARAADKIAEKTAA
jgi:large subunit ribosomal protein L28